MHVQWDMRHHRRMTGSCRQARDPRRQSHRDKKEEPSEIPRRTGNVPSVLLIDKKRERKREQSGADNPGEAGQTADRALQLALFRFAHPSRHHSLRRRARDRPKHHHWNGEKEKQTARETSSRDVSAFPLPVARGIWSSHRLALTRNGG